MASWALVAPREWPHIDFEEPYFEAEGVRVLAPPVPADLEIISAELVPDECDEETAYLLGFSEPSTFSRAFKRLTGKSPQQFRSGRSG